MTARKQDLNGFVTIEKNPISRSGVFQYLGRSIDPKAEPDQLYGVYRPDEELADPETIESMKLLPFIDEHAMLGHAANGHTPAEDKGTHGTTGEIVTFEDGVLYSNLKLFSHTLYDVIQRGKNNLSLGYRCIYEKASGFFNGEPYQYIQRKIRGNHLALVNEARCAVEVLDHKYTFDHIEIVKKGVPDMAVKATTGKDEDEGKGANEMTLSEVAALLQEILPQVRALTEAMAAKSNPDDAVALDDDDKKKNDDKDDDKDEKKKEAADEDDADKDKDKDKKKDDKKEGMDAAELKSLRGDIADIKKNGMKSLLRDIAVRDSLASQISQHVGTFDHSEMTPAEVAEYGVKELGIKCKKGEESAALSGFLQARKPSTTGFALDSAHRPKSSEVDKYLNAE